LFLSAQTIFKNLLKRTLKKLLKRTPKKVLIIKRGSGSYLPL